MWAGVIGESSTSVAKSGRINRPDGANLRTRPLPSQPAFVNIPFNSLVQVQRRTEQGWAWILVLDGTAAGQVGFVVEDRVAVEPPEPTAQLHWVTGGERLGLIATRYYGASLNEKNNERLYVQALYEANRDRAGVYLEEVNLPTSETWHRWESDEESVRIFKGLKVKRDHALWIPSIQFVQALKQTGVISDGRSFLTNAWESAKQLVDSTVDGVTYGAGFLVGLLEGAWKALFELFQGAAELLETVGKTVLHALTGNFAAIKQMATELVGKLKGAWEHRGEIADAFLRKWNAPDMWDRGNFQGEVIGWVIMTVVLAVMTAGEGAIATALGSSAWGARFLTAVRAADALGDVANYARGLSRAIKLPAKAMDALRPELRVGEKAAGTTRAGEKAEKATARETDQATSAAGAKAEMGVGEAITVRGYAQGPRLKWARNADGAVRSVDEAIEIARKNGVLIEDDILLKKLSGKYLPDNTYARYFRTRHENPLKSISWSDFYDKQLDELLVHIEESVFHSDEAIVAILAHEMHEINNLRKLFDESGGFMTLQRLHYLINPGIKGNLHDQAWDVADQAVLLMRKKKEPTP